MSGSPKYSQAELEAQRQQELEAQRRRQAALEAQRRREREAKERRRRVADSQQRLAMEATAVAADLVRHSQASYAPFAGTGFTLLEKRRAVLTKEAQLADDLGRLRQLEASLEALAREAKAVVAQARAAEQAEQLQKLRARKQAEAEAAVMGLAARLEGSSETLARKFDPAGRAEVCQRLEQARAGLSVGQLEGARVHAEHGIARFEVHIAAVASAHQAWDAERLAATGALETLQLRLEATLEDEVVQTWCSEDLTALGRQVQAMAARLGAEDWQGVLSAAASAGQALDLALERAQLRQLEEEKRAYIVNGLLSVLQQQGFQVGAPNLLKPGDLESEVVIRAIRPDRRALSIQVPVSGRVSYEVDGWARRQEAVPDGGLAQTCDEAESRLQAIHAQIKDEFGVNMGELQWEGKHPLRLRKGAKDLPSDGRISQERGRRV